MTEAKKKRVVTVRIARTWEEAEQFDREWWEQFTPEERVGMLWGMTLEYLAFKGLSNEPRLQRSLCRIQRRGR